MAEIEKMNLESLDLVDERLVRMRELFPEVFSESGIDFEKLRIELGDEVDDGDERYAFTWPGKLDAVRQAQTVSTAALRPRPEKSRGRDGEDGSFDSDNIYVEGDNLEVLKLLQRGYHGKVKMIYIDPPYNTGKDFVYKDSFSDSIENYRIQAGISGQSNADTSGSYHSNWCTMIYPRIRLARELLADDGMLFMSINDYEHINAAKLLEEVFGASNFIEEYVWESTFRPDNTSPINRKNVEYVICYAKNRKCVSRLIGDRQRSEGLPSLTKSSMKLSTLSFRAGEVSTFLPDGIYNAGDKGSYSLENDVEVLNGKIVTDFRLTGHVIWGQDYLKEQLSSGTEIIIKNESFVPYSKKKSETVHSPNKLIPRDRVGDVLKANAERDELFASKVFDYPKPTSLLTYLISYIDDDDYYVLDFFSGSGTTAHAVMLANASDNGKRKFIMVQLPEPTPEGGDARNAGFIDLCAVGEERIRRAGDKIKADFEVSSRQLKLDEEHKRIPDIGFRVFTLDESGIRKPETGQLLLDCVKPDRSDLDTVFEMMLKWGLELTLPVELEELAGYPCYTVAYGELVCCLAPGLTIDVLEAIATLDPRRVLMLDRILDDSLKLNAVQIFKRVEERTGREVELRTV